MTTNDTPQPGIDDGLLVRYLDGELDAAEQQRIDAALAHDRVLVQRLETLRRRSGTLRSLLERSDLPFEGPGVRSIESARAPRTSRVWLRAAAVILLLGGAIAAVPPLRAWVVTQVQRVTGNSGNDETPAPAPADAGFATSFVVTSTTIDIVVGRQAGGRLIVRVEDVTEATASVRRTRDQGEEVMWQAGTLRITSTAASTAEFDVVVPASVTTVRVRLPDAEPIVYTTAEPSNRSRVFDLGPR